MNKRHKVFVGMSGGVDSSVTAWLLKRAGYDVVGVFMRSYNLDGCADRDAEDARRTAEQIGIPFYVWDFEEEYKKKVVDYMVHGYRIGLTPNPDVMCNREIKFGIFLDKALAAGADYVATGHYVRIKKMGTKYKLFAGKDPNKDQSYFLWTLTQGQLKHCLFPIGGYLKPQVRALARRAKLPTAAKKDSQGICFLGQISLEDFLKKRIPEKRGDILTLAGEKIGEHNGAHFYTIGQRHGLDLREKNRALGVHGSQATLPHYVVSKNVKKNIIVVAEGDMNEALYRREVVLADINVIGDAAAHGGVAKRSAAKKTAVKRRMFVMARVRYRQPLAKAWLLPAPKGAAHGSDRAGALRLQFEKPQKFVAEGQSAVWYSKSGEMLGGGVIMQ